MISRLALRPDLDECLLEDRTLLYAGPGLYASQFIPTAGMSPSFIVSGFQQSNTGPGSSGSTNPGPQFFYLQIGLNSASNGGIRLGGSFAIFSPPQVLPVPQGPSTGDSTGSSSGGGGPAPSVGYGGTISSGYNTALSSSNNFAMGSTALGSVTAHISGTTDQLMEAQAGNNVGQSTTETEPNMPIVPAPSMGQGPLSNNQDRLLGKGLGNSGGLLIGPGMNAPKPNTMSPHP